MPSPWWENTFYVWFFLIFFTGGTDEQVLDSYEWGAHDMKAMTEGGASEWITIIRVCESDTQSLDLSLPWELPFKKKKKWLKHFFFPAVCKSALNVASICRACPSLQQAAGAAASICCGNEDGTEAKGKGYRQVGEEGKKTGGVLRKEGQSWKWNTEKK